jgi:hypothetical protein
MDHIVVGWISLKNSSTFKCLSVADRQYRIFDVVENSPLVDLAHKMTNISFTHIQRSQVHVLADQVLVIVSENDGESLSRFALKLETSINEHFMRQMIKSLLEAVLYVAESFGIDFKFTVEDVIVTSEKCNANKFRFKLRNSFIQKARINFLRPIDITTHTTSHAIPIPRSNSRTTCVPVQALHSLGTIATAIAKNRYGFSDCRLEFGCPWASESLGEVITSLTQFDFASGSNPKSLLSRFMTGMELKFERMKNANLIASRYDIRTRSLGAHRKSSPF